MTLVQMTSGSSAVWSWVAADSLMLIPPTGLPGFASSFQEGLKAALLLCQTLHTAIMLLLLASPAASLRIPVLLGHHGGSVLGVSWQGIAGDCTIAPPLCKHKWVLTAVSAVCLASL